MANNFAAAIMVALLMSASAQSRDLSNEQRAYVAKVTVERQAADLKMRDQHWSPLALTQMFFLDTKNVSIGSGDADSLVLQGPAVVAGHAEVVAKSAGEHMQYTLRAAAGPVFIDSNNNQDVTELLLEKGGPRLRVGRNILYFREGDWLGPRINVLDFESPAYTLFDGLDYFPIDPEYRVEAVLQPYDEPRETQIIDTMGFVSTAWVYGVASFTLKGEPSQLKVVLFTQDPTPETIFYVMFGDKTNGRESYGAGRYLLPKFVPSGSITLDFNRSVNPSCAYNSGFACPMPPAGNRFSFKVPAGIKDYSHRPPR
jgi:uncharacterized protein